MPQRFNKDPDAELDYSVDWESWLASDTIATSTWTVPAGLTEESSSNTTTKGTVVLSGGTAGQRYCVVNRITTAGGKIDDRTIYIDMIEK